MLCFIILDESAQYEEPTFESERIVLMKYFW